MQLIDCVSTPEQDLRYSIDDVLLEHVGQDLDQRLSIVVGEGLANVSG